MTDIIEQCALAMVNSQAAACGWAESFSMSEFQNAHEILGDVRAVLAKFKELTAEPTPEMIEAADIADAEYGERNFGSGRHMPIHQPGYEHWPIMHQVMFQEIGV